ncbi:hypothetical protein BG844_07555 [Couchioplanes caeruleus subsp. caeruleus]|uniref:Uncharacterized protein n=1 Tax=Couchioplanes caeruleus subsp. caeruleus TaxID=56427 RepID=A0A1K0FPV1_9ACTN|nr:hypothetical protein BG844_07555 [Couchioplanes caeruleus subsp. caeruleus]
MAATAVVAEGRRMLVAGRRARSIQVIAGRHQARQLPTILDLRTGAYLRPIDAVTSVLGATHPVWDLELPIGAPPDPEHQRLIISRLTPLLPWLPEVTVDRVVCGFDGYCADGSPLLQSMTAAASSSSVRSMEAVSASRRRSRGPSPMRSTTGSPPCPVYVSVRSDRDGVSAAVEDAAELRAGGQAHHSRGGVGAVADQPAVAAWPARPAGRDSAATRRSAPYERDVLAVGLRAAR